MASKRKSLQTEPFWLLLTSPRLSTRSGTLLFFTNSFCSNSPLASYIGYAPSFLIVELKSRLVVSTAAPSASDVGSPRAQHLVQSSSFCLLMTSLRIYLGVPMPPCMLTIWPSICPTYGDFHSIQRSVSRPFSLQIPIKPLSNPGWTSWASLFCSIPPLNSLVWPLIGLYPLWPMSNPCVPNSTHATKPFAQLPLPLGVLQKNLSPYSTKPLSVRCSHMPLLDGSHSFATLQPITWKFYTELHAGSLLDASLPPPPHYSFSRPNSLL